MVFVWNLVTLAPRIIHFVSDGLRAAFSMEKRKEKVENLLDGRERLYTWHKTLYGIFFMNQNRSIPLSKVIALHTHLLFNKSTFFWQKYLWKNSKNWNIYGKILKIEKMTAKVLNGGEMANNKVLSKVCQNDQIKV